MAPYQDTSAWCSSTSGTIGNSWFRCGSLRQSGGRWLRRVRCATEVSQEMDGKAASRSIDGAQWDADCDAAYEVALPPRWEFRDRAWSAPGVWRAFPDAVSNDINTFARQGRRRININLGGSELVVDLQDLVAVPTDQYAVPRMLRKTVQQTRVSRLAVKKLYMQYSADLEPSDHPQGPDAIHGEAFLQLFQDLGVDPSADVSALALSQACNAEVMGIFRRREFICGCVALEVNTLEELRAKMPELRDGVVKGRLLPDVYGYTFGVAVEAPCKVLPLEEAQQYWALLLHEWPLREEFCEWAGRHMKAKAINRDLWNQILKFATEVPGDLSTYDDNPSWPVVIDDFVEYHRSK